MKTPSSTAVGRVASLHIHPDEPGEPFHAVEVINVVAEKGIIEDRRYFGRVSRSTGQPNRRQVSLIEREQIAEHAAECGLQTIPPGVVRANIETTGLSLQALVGREVEIGEAVLFFYAPRTPCEKMNRICAGLRERMENGRQGVMAQVRKSGVIRVGDVIRGRET